jgi:hypothetical protein
MAQIVHAQKVTECRTQEMKASYEILAAISQINGALRGYIIARLNNDPDETARLHAMIDHLWTDIDTATGSLQALDPSLRSAESQSRFSTLLADLKETRRQQYDYLGLEGAADEGAHQASLSINLNSALWSEKVRTGSRALVDAVSEASNRERRNAALSPPSPSSPPSASAFSSPEPLPPPPFSPAAASPPAASPPFPSLSPTPIRFPPATLPSAV